MPIKNLRSDFSLYLVVERLSITFCVQSTGLSTATQFLDLFLFQVSVSSPNQLDLLDYHLLLEKQGKFPTVPTRVVNEQFGVGISETNY